MTRHDEYIVDHRALDTTGGEFGLVGNLRLIFVEVLRHIDHRLLHQFQVTRTTDDNTHRDGIIGFCLGLVELGRDGELTYPTREVCRTLGQRIYLDIDARGHDLLLDLDVTGTAVKESLKGIDITVLLNHDSLEGDARNLEFTRHLGEHHILAPRASAVRTPVDSLYRKALLLWQIHLLGVETLKVGHIATQLGE